MTSTRPSARSGPSTARAFVVGFVLGAVVTVPTALAALLSTTAERLAPLLTPGVALLRPVSDAMADWPGAVNLLLACLSNALVVGAAAAAGALVLRRGRR